MRLVAVKIFVEKTEMGIKGCSTVSCLLIKRKPKEEERIKRLNLSDEKAFNTYDAIHMRMLGQ